MIGEVVPWNDSLQELAAQQAECKRVLLSPVGNQLQ